MKNDRSTATSAILRAATDAHHRYCARFDTEEQAMIEEDREAVAEVLALWGTTPCPDAAHLALMNVATFTQSSAVRSAAKTAFALLGDPARIRDYLAGGDIARNMPGANKGRLGVDGPGVLEHPSTREAAKARAAEWLAMPRDRQISRDRSRIQQKFHGAINDLDGEPMVREKAVNLGVIEEWEERWRLAETIWTEHEKNQRIAAVVRAERDARKPVFFDRVVELFGDKTMKAGRAENMILPSSVIELLWRMTFPNETAPLVRHAPMDIGSNRLMWRFSPDLGGCFFHRNETPVTVERVSWSAYERFVEYRRAYTPPSTVEEPFGPVMVEWTFQTVEWVGENKRAYVASCAVTFADTVTVVGRRWLADF